MLLVGLAKLLYDAHKISHRDPEHARLKSTYDWIISALERADISNRDMGVFVDFDACATHVNWAHEIDIERAKTTLAEMGFDLTPGDADAQDGLMCYMITISGH